ncbi:hypothetical protein FH584_08315 [Leptospira interrogans]|uniref:hypothetical protein n=1 Tax=Leptospira interrogans TaxID=173 RepID=UPI0010C0855D|nr:hypothetical protein [Leptospira interrogans]QCO36946.1 hypothetical protein E4412_06790 [Leptospira interrogans]ULG93867.1 hypothetical protein FH584_08315 [Leptospira interrogans]
MFLHKRIRFFCFFIFLLSFANCLTATLREEQKRMSFYEYERPTLEGIRILQDRNYPILELSYIRGNEKKFSYYCATSPQGNDQKKDIYIYDVQFRRFEQTCEFKNEDSNQPIRVEKAERKLFLYDVGTAINDLPWLDSDDTSLTIYRGPYLSKKISDIKQAWTVKQRDFDFKLCIADSKNRIAALDCSKREYQNKYDRFKILNVCIMAEFDCSQQPNSESLSLSKIPKSPPTYFSTTRGWIYTHSRDKNYAIWLSEPSPTQMISPIVLISFDPSFKAFSPANLVAYGLSYLLYPFTIVIDVLTTPILIVYFTYAFRNFDGFF